jgi:hypothetical protein
MIPKIRILPMIHVANRLIFVNENKASRLLHTVNHTGHRKNNVFR